MPLMANFGPDVPGSHCMPGLEGCRFLSDVSCWASMTLFMWRTPLLSTRLGMKVRSLASALFRVASAGSESLFLHVGPRDERASHSSRDAMSCNDLRVAMSPSSSSCGRFCGLMTVCLCHVSGACHASRRLPRRHKSCMTGRVRLQHLSDEFCRSGSAAIIESSCSETCWTSPRSRRLDCCCG